VTDQGDPGDPWGTPSDQPPQGQPPQGQPPQPGQAGQPGQPGQPAQPSQPGWGPSGAPGAPGAPSYPASYPPAQPQPPAYGYGQPTPAWGGAQPYYGGPQTSGRATTVLVLGIVSLVLLFSCIGFIPAIVALVLAKGARREIAESGGRLTGESQVKAGTIMSWITVALTVVGAVALAAVIAVAVSTSDSTEPTIGRALERAPAAFDLRPSAG
jgi:uncharacterized protein DUF4190